MAIKGLAVVTLLLGGVGGYCYLRNTSPWNFENYGIGLVMAFFAIICPGILLFQGQIGWLELFIPIITTIVGWWVGICIYIR